MAESADVLSRAASAGDPAGSGRRLLDGRHGAIRPARDVLAATATAWASRRASFPSRTSTRRRRSKRSCGEHGGIVCTSSNAAATLEWAWERGEQHPVPARPASRPQHRVQDGRAARPDGRVGSERAVGRPDARAAQARDADPVEGPLLGARALHRRNRSSTCASSIPGIRVIVHPEVPFDVVQAADDCGSTEYISSTVRESAPGSMWAVGTEVHLVIALRTKSRPKDRRVARPVRLPVLDDVPRLAESSAVDARGLVDGEVHNRIVVPDEQKHWAKVALDRMLHS